MFLTVCQNICHLQLKLFNLLFFESIKADNIHQSFDTKIKCSYKVCWWSLLHSNSMIGSNCQTWPSILLTKLGTIYLYLT